MTVCCAKLFHEKFFVWIYCRTSSIISPGQSSDSRGPSRTAQWKVPIKTRPTTSGSLLPLRPWAFKDYTGSSVSAVEAQQQSCSGIRGLSVLRASSFGRCLFAATLRYSTHRAGARRERSSFHVLFLRLKFARTGSTSRRNDDELLCMKRWQKCTCLF